MAGTFDTTHQTTLDSWTSAGGIGLHTGRRAELSIGPAPTDSGVVFVRGDLPNSPEIPAVAESIERSDFCTVLCREGVTVSTVEHILAALYGLGIDNATIVVDGPEVPIMDGSAAGFVELIRKAGIRRQNAPRRVAVLAHRAKVSDGDRFVSASPSGTLSIECTIAYDHPLVHRQKAAFRPASNSFEEEIAPARTFGFLAQVDEMKKNGYARGGSLDNAIVVDAFSVINPEGLRYTDEFARHKLLDILGDLALLGARLRAKVLAHKSGHSLHHRFVRKLLTEPGLLKIQGAAVSDAGRGENTAILDLASVVES